MAARKSPKTGAKELAVRQQLQAENVCGGITRKGSVCMNPAGSGTDHPGVGPCHIHDNAARIISRQTGARYKDGVAPSALELFLEQANDPEIKRLDEEIALMRVRLNDIELMIQEIRKRNVGDDGESVLLPRAYGEKFDPAGTADHKAMLQLQRDSSKIAESVAKLIDRKHKIEEGKLVTYRQVQEVLGQVIYVIKKNCDGCNNLPRIAEDFATIDISKFEPK